MQKDPFVTLGVDESVTQNELYEAYKAARAKTNVSNPATSVRKRVKNWTK